MTLQRWPNAGCSDNSLGQYLHLVRRLRFLLGVTMLACVSMNADAAVCELMARMCLHAVDASVSASTESTVQIRWVASPTQSTHVGFGVAVAPGVVATPSHCCEGLDRLQVATRDGRLFPVRGVLSSHPIEDIAFLKVPGLNCPVPRRRAEWRDIQPGSLGMVVANRGTEVSRSALAVTTRVCGEAYAGVHVELAFDALPGDSGAPVYAADGALLGILIGSTRPGASALSPIMEWSAFAERAARPDASVVPLPRDSQRYRELQFIASTGAQEERVAAWSKLTDDFPEGGSAIALRNELASNARRCVAALEELERRHPESLVIRLYLAQALILASDHETARMKLESLYLTPIGKNAKRAVVLHCRHKGRLQLIAAIQELVTTWPECPCTWEVAAEKYRGLVMPSAELDAYRHLTAIQPRFIGHWQERARLARVCALPEEAADAESRLRDLEAAGGLDSPVK